MATAKLTLPNASGPGVYADEADSMANSLSLMGGEKARGMLQLLETIDADARAQTSDVKSAVKIETLIRLANLVTGSWGQYTSAWRTTRPVPDNFMARMQELYDSLSYINEGIASKKRDTPWVRGYFGGNPGGLYLCQLAVGWVLTEGRERHSMFCAAGYPLGHSWGVLAKGNGKLPFWAYSELPMATCGGAGPCGKFPNSKSPGWCYSFKAWRYPDAFARQFLNTLANVTDEFFHFNRAIMPVGTKKTNPVPKAVLKLGEKMYKPGDRVWMEYVKELVLYKSRTQRKNKTIFLRLFVDGDIHNAYALEEWMKVCKKMGPRGVDTQNYAPTGKRLKHMEIYGYSKAWKEFELVAGRKSRDWWPDNYTLNLSSGSRHANNKPLVALMESLPISRGYFAVISLNTHMQEFMGSMTGKMAGKTRPQVQKLVAQFVEINDLTDKTTNLSTVNAIAKKIGADPLKTTEGMSVNDMRATLFSNWTNHLTTDPYMRDLALQEMQKDTGKKKPVQFSEKRLKSKIVALHLMDVLWAYGLGGSCPLVCGNCFDVYDAADPYKAADGVHRCASKKGSQFGRTTDDQIGPTINIGLH